VRDVVADHRRACAGFGAVVERVPDDRWDAPTPCTEWDARAVVEHVIGFHDVLVLTPLGAKPARPRGDVVARWRVTADALGGALGRPGAIGDERRTLVGVLTTDVLVHTWDLAVATGIDAALDEELCAIGFERADASRERLRASGLFGPPVDVADDASATDKLVALFGRDPTWAPPRR
jgi:uncharacterized protein (TIGR03086 family)